MRGRYPQEESWRESAACKGLDPAIFFPPEEKDEALAKAICATCPVRSECLEWAMATNQEGIWGGTNETERRRLKRRRRDHRSKVA
jgi:WhiB family redox-sensing transcriptional regulator